MKQILDRVVALLIVMRNLEEPAGQKRVNDRSKKNDGRNKVERFPLNPSGEFSEERRNLLVMVAIARQRKIDSRPRQPCSGSRKRSQTQQSETKKSQRSTHGTQQFIVPSSREPVIAAGSIRQIARKKKAPVNMDRNCQFPRYLR